MLNDTFSDRLRLLTPKEIMGRNELCWCKSGVKWKKCHYVRESQQPDALTRLLHEFDKQKALSVCLHGSAPFGCGAKIIRAHTVQKSGSLSAIAEDGHVYSGRDRGWSRGHIGADDELALIGVSNASTFKGFCSRHDNDTFKAADIATEVTKEAAFLMAYRALAYEIYMKMVAIPTMETLKNRIDRGVNFENQARIQTEFDLGIQGLRHGLHEHQQHKTRYDQLLNGTWKTDFNGCHISFDGTLPITSSGAFFPEFDFHGNALQNMGNDLGRLSLLAFNLVVIDNRTVAIFGWDTDATGSNARFAESLSNIPPRQMADALVQFCFEISDNIFVRPSWWSAVPKSTQSELLSRLRNNIPGRHSPEGLVIGDAQYVIGNLVGSFKTL